MERTALQHIIVLMLENRSFDHMRRSSMRLLSLLALTFTVAMIRQPAVGAQTDGVPETGFFAQSAGANAGPATQAVPQGSPTNPRVDPIGPTSGPYSVRWKWKDSAIVSA